MFKPKLAAFKDIIITVTCHDKETNRNAFNSLEPTPRRGKGLNSQELHRISHFCRCSQYVSLALQRKPHNNMFEGNNCVSSSKTKMNKTRMGAVITL
jgi:hypothetical protein